MVETAKQHLSEVGYPKVDIKTAQVRSISAQIFKTLEDSQQQQVLPIP